jgi:hypothetical protein
MPAIGRGAVSSGGIDRLRLGCAFREAESSLRMAGELVKSEPPTTDDRI